MKEKRELKKAVSPWRELYLRHWNWSSTEALHSSVQKTNGGMVNIKKNLQSKG